MNGLGPLGGWPCEGISVMPIGLVVLYLITNYQIYNLNLPLLEKDQKLFKHKRTAHLEAVKGVLELKNYEKQYKMVSLLTEKIVKVCINNKFTVFNWFHTVSSLIFNDICGSCYSYLYPNMYHLPF